jgi:hypothetical protein
MLAEAVQVVSHASVHLDPSAAVPVADPVPRIPSRCAIGCHLSQRRTTSRRGAQMSERRPSCPLSLDTVQYRRWRTSR